MLIFAPLNEALLNEALLNKIKTSSSFDTGNTPVNSFLFDDALDMQSHNYVCTTIAIDEEEQDVVGFYGLSTDALERQDAEKDPYKEKFKHFPALKLQWFGINKKYQGKKYGQRFIQRIIAHALELNSHESCDWAVGCRFITLDAKYNFTKPDELTENSYQFYLARNFKPCDKMRYKNKFMKFSKKSGKGIVSMYFDIFDDLT